MLFLFRLKLLVKELIQIVIWFVLQYADDIVHIPKTGDDIQLMLNLLANCCTSNAMLVNPTKSNIVHFRHQSPSRFPFDFKCGENSHKTVGQYTYWVYFLTSFLIIIRLLIVKLKVQVGHCGNLLPYQKHWGRCRMIFVKMYDSMVWPIFSYVASILGSMSFFCINAFISQVRTVYTYDSFIWRVSMTTTAFKTVEI